MGSGKYYLLDSGIWILESGFWNLDSGIWILESGFWNLNSSIPNDKL